MAAASQALAVSHMWVHLSWPGNPPLQRGALGCGNELTPTRGLPGRHKPVGKMSLWLVLGCSHHYHLPKDRAKSAVAAEPTITVDYVPALPGGQCSPHPRSRLWGHHQCSKIPLCAPMCHLLQGWPGSLRAFWTELVGESLQHPFPRGSSTCQPLPNVQWDQEGAWHHHQSQKLPHNPLSSSGFQRERQ